MVTIKEKAVFRNFKKIFPFLDIILIAEDTSHIYLKVGIQEKFNHYTKYEVIDVIKQQLTFVKDGIIKAKIPLFECILYEDYDNLTYYWIWKVSKRKIIAIKGLV